jgi:hypothetical protein
VNRLDRSGSTSFVELHNIRMTHTVPIGEGRLTDWIQNLRTARDPAHDRLLRWHP